MIALPESVAFYWSEPTNMAAVNLLVDRTDVPPDLDLDEVEQFLHASLAAQRVRLDFWRLLRQLWAASWGAAVAAALHGARLLNYEGHMRFNTDAVTPSVETAWNDSATFGLFDLAGRGTLVTRLRFTDPRCRNVELSFYFRDLDGTWPISDGLDLGPDWTNDNGWRSTRLTIDSSGADRAGIDLQAAAEVTRDAIASLAGALR